jgi:hypothetical protein
MKNELVCPETSTDSKPGPMPDLLLMLRRLTSDGNGWSWCDWEAEKGVGAVRRLTEDKDSACVVVRMNERADPKNVVIECEVPAIVNGLTIDRDAWHKMSTAEKRNLFKALMQACHYTLDRLMTCVKGREKTE